jgi:hypothetical protein
MTWWRPVSFGTTAKGAASAVPAVKAGMAIRPVRPIKTELRDAVAAAVRG